MAKSKKSNKTLEPKETATEIPKMAEQAEKEIKEEVSEKPNTTPVSNRPAQDLPPVSDNQ